MKIAFLGLGNMGFHMARNLAAAGYDVTGYDVVEKATQAVAEHGVTPAETARAAVDGADVVITMFPAGKHVLEAYQNDLLDAAKPDTLFIDSSTIAVDDAVKAAAMAREAGHRALDAPVSGGTKGARSEEHTSELQSRGQLVCRLLLEKKKRQQTKQPP